MSTTRVTDTRSSLGRARVAGALALIVAFASGFGSAWLIRRERSTGLQLTVTATDELPDELVRLGLSGTQRAQAQDAIRRGRDRVLHVVDTFDPAMSAVMDSTDAEIRAILSEQQRAAFDAARTGSRMGRTRVMKP